MLKKQKTDDEIKKLYHPYMFLNGRNLCFFFSENQDALTNIQQTMSKMNKTPHLFLYDYDGNFPLENILRKKKVMALKLMIEYMSKHQDRCFYSSVFE